MPKKGFQKKKAHQSTWCEIARKGLVNGVDGKPVKPGGRTETTDRMALSGALHRRMS